MNDFVRLFLGSKSALEVLIEEAEAIKSIGNDARVFTFNQKEREGYVTANSRPKAVEDVAKEAASQ